LGGYPLKNWWSSSTAAARSDGGGRGRKVQIEVLSGMTGVVATQPVSPCEAINPNPNKPKCNLI